MGLYNIDQRTRRVEVMGVGVTIRKLPAWVVRWLQGELLRGQEIVRGPNGEAVKWEKNLSADEWMEQAIQVVKYGVVEWELKRGDEVVPVTETEIRRVARDVPEFVDELSAVIQEYSALSTQEKKR